MKNFAGRFIVGFLLCFVFAIAAFAQIQQRDLQKEAEIQQQLQKIAPKTVDKFKTATENMDEGNYQESVELYNEVLAEAPNFDPAMRRLGFALMMTGKRFEGLEMSRKTLNLDRTPENLSSLAMNLISSPTRKSTTRSVPIAHCRIYTK